MTDTPLNGISSHITFTGEKPESASEWDEFNAGFGLAMMRQRDAFRPEVRMPTAKVVFNRTTPVLAYSSSAYYYIRDQRPDANRWYHLGYASAASTIEAYLLRAQAEKISLVLMPNLYFRKGKRRKL